MKDHFFTPWFQHFECSHLKGLEAKEWNKGCENIVLLWYTLPETNIAPETLGLEDKFPFKKASWQVLW